MKVRGKEGIFFVLLLCCCAAQVRAEGGIGVDVGLQTGYRLDRLDWTIAGNSNGTSPNILSELTWSDIQIAHIQGSGELSLGREKCAGVSPRAFLSLGYGRIFNGDNQDSDYARNDRQGEWSRSNNSTDAGSVLDLSYGLGTRFFLDDDKLTLTPMFGYSYHEQNMHITDGWQTIPATGSFAGLDSRYETEWGGPWFGLETGLHPSDKLQFSLLFSYHFALSYLAEGCWNLRHDLMADSFKQKATDGHGYTVAVGGDYFFTKALNFFINVEYRSFTVADGSEWKYFTNGNVSKTRLNEVNWSARTFAGGLRYFF